MTAELHSSKVPLMETLNQSMRTIGVSHKLFYVVGTRHWLLDAAVFLSHPHIELHV